MNNINYDDGYKSYTLNNDENKVIRINTTDMSILKRLNTARKNIQKISDELSKINEDKMSVDDIINRLDDCDKKIRAEINYIFGSDVATLVFGITNCASMSGGQPLFMRFINGVIPVIENDIKSEQGKKIAKYTSQAKKLSK